MPWSFSFRMFTVHMKELVIRLERIRHVTLRDSNESESERFVHRLMGQLNISFISFQKYLKYAIWNLCRMELRSAAIKEEKTQKVSKAKVHGCPMCESRFVRFDGLQLHIRDVHTKERPFKCEECEKTFKDKKQLSNHVERIHRKIQGSNRCPSCDKCFYEPAHLRKHMESHIPSAERRRDFECQFCHKRSFSKQVT